MKHTTISTIITAKLKLLRTQFEKIDVLIVIYELPITEVFKIGFFRFDEHFLDHFIQFHAPRLLVMHRDESLEQ